MAVTVLDWSMARHGAPMACVDCGRPASLREPGTQRARHKTCAELVQQTSTRQEPEPAVAALGPERAAKRRESVRHVPGGRDFDVARFRDLLAVWPPTPVKLHRDTPESGGAPAVLPPTREVLVACRAVQEGDPVPRSVGTVRKALESAGWTVQATYAAARLEGVEHHSVVLRCGRAGVRAWAGWTDGKATGGQVRGVRGHLAVGAWRVATGSAPTLKAPRRGATQDAPAEDVYSPPMVDLDAMVDGGA